MSLHRVLASGCNAAAARSCSAVLSGRLSSPAATSASTTCLHSLSRCRTSRVSTCSAQPFTQRTLSSKRLLQTATAVRPSSESTDHPQPLRTARSDEPLRNSAKVPGLNDIRNPVPQSEQGRSATTTIAPSNTDPKSAASSTTQTPPKLTTTESIKAKPRKLRPRKAAMTLTPTAVSKLRGLLDGPNPQLIRVGVRNRGCSGLAYNLEYVSEPGKFDETVEQDGVRVLIDSKALFSIIGSEMDWVEDKLSEKFVFRNPNIKEECGCGESFMV